MGSVPFLRNTHGKDIGSLGESGDDDGDDIFARYPPARFTVAGQSYAWPVLRISESGGNRIIERERPYRDGAKLDDTGSKAKRWTMECVFNNSLEVPGLSALNNGVALYPDVLNDLIFAFDTHQTGDLVVPTVGTQRARAESYSRTESMDDRNQAIVTLVFCEDNEDNVDFRSISAPTGGSNATRLAETTEFDTQSFGSWSEGLLAVQEGLLELEDFVNAPGNAAQDIESAALRVEGSARRATRTFSEAGRPGRNLFLDPANSRGPRKLTQAEDMAARERANARRGRPAQTTVVFRDSQSIFSIAAALEQDPGDLLGINPDVDPNFIPAGDPVNVFVTEDLLNAGATTAR